MVDGGDRLLFVLVLVLLFYLPSPELFPFAPSLAIVLPEKGVDEQQQHQDAERHEKRLGDIIKAGRDGEQE